MSKLYKEIYKLKNTLRSGWVKENMSDPFTHRFESDAEHVFSMCILATEIMSKEDLGLDQSKVLKMILFHEIGEVDVGDITPSDHVPKNEKYKRELKCVERIASECNMPEIAKLWKEFERGNTKEAKFVKKLDKLDTVMQSKIYSELNEDNNRLFGKFYNSQREKIHDFIDYLQ